MRLPRHVRALIPALLAASISTVLPAGTTPLPAPLIGDSTVAAQGSLPRPAADSVAPRIRDGDAARVVGPSPLPLSALTGYRWPLAHPRITLPFGPSRWGSRVVDGSLFHDGVDMATFCGDRIVAAHAGTVIASGRHFDAAIGWVGDLRPYFARLEAKHLWGILPIVVVIDDGNGYRSIYAHFERTTVKVGQRVLAGDLLGYEGRTGRATGCHLHYGLFSPLERGRFPIEPAVVKRMLVPPFQVARVDPMAVLPPLPVKGTPAGTLPERREVEAF